MQTTSLETLSVGGLRFCFALAARACRSGVLLLEAIDATFGIHQLLTAGEERMAMSADFHADVALIGRPGLERVPACAVDFYFVVSRMNTRFHNGSYLFDVNLHRV